VGSWLWVGVFFVLDLLIECFIGTFDCFSTDVRFVMETILHVFSSAQKLSTLHYLLFFLSHRYCQRLHRRRQVQSQQGQWVLQGLHVGHGEEQHRQERDHAAVRG
jgi:hypothetical protein